MFRIKLVVVQYTSGSEVRYRPIIVTVLSRKQKSVWNVIMSIIVCTVHWKSKRIICC